MTTRQFAEKMEVHYRTALKWLDAGLVPGAMEEKVPYGAQRYFLIPVTALSMIRPVVGRKKKAQSKS